MLLTHEPVLRRFWYPLAFSSKLDAGPVHRRLLGHDLVIWRAAGVAGAAIDRCPHREAKLSRGWVSGERLVCPYHGWEFQPDGRVANIPQLEPDSPLPTRARLGTLACQERYGWVWVCLDDDPLGGIPVLPEWDAAGWRVVPEYEWMFACSCAHLIENNIDASHIAFVHRESFGAGIDPRVDAAPMVRTPYGLIQRSTIPVAGRPGESTPSVRISTNEIWAPFLGVFRIAYPDGLVHIMVKACTPEDDATTRLLQFVVRNDTEADRPAADIVAFDNKVEAEDQAVLAGLGPEYPLDPTLQFHTKADRPVLELRRWYSELISGSWTPTAAVPIDA
jgi:nitrite reductase/ring-hydroxylating ferredoxin subunit